MFKAKKLVMGLVLSSMLCSSSYLAFGNQDNIITKNSMYESNINDTKMETYPEINNDDYGIMPLDLHELYLQSDDGESTSSTFTLEGKKEARYQLTNKNGNEVSWELIKKGWFGTESIVASGTLQGKAQTPLTKIDSTSSGTYFFKGSTTNGDTINVYCRYREID